MAEAKVLWVGNTFDAQSIFKCEALLALPSTLTYNPVTVYYNATTTLSLVDQWGKEVLQAGQEWDFVTLQDLPTEGCCLLRFVLGTQEVTVIKIKKTSMPAWTVAGRLFGDGKVDQRTPEAASEKTIKEAVDVAR